MTAQASKEVIAILEEFLEDYGDHFPLVALPVIKYLKNVKPSPEIQRKLAQRLALRTLNTVTLGKEDGSASSVELNVNEVRPLIERRSQPAFYWCPSSVAHARVSPSSAALDEAYTDVALNPARAATLEMLTMRGAGPKCDKAACTRNAGRRKFTSYILSQNSCVRSLRRQSSPIPALLTMISILPYSSIAVCTIQFGVSRSMPLPCTTIALRPSCRISSATFSASWWAAL